MPPRKYSLAQYSANYGGVGILLTPAKRLAAEVLGGRLPIDAIDEHQFDRCQNLAGQPSVDLIIRTGGEYRISIFCYGSRRMPSFFTDILWPDFDGDALDTCLLEFAGRERRFGKTSEQVVI